MLTRGEFPRRFVVSPVGECSYCFKKDGEVCAFAAIAERSDLICGQCLALCLDVTCELDKRDEREAKSAQLFRLEPQHEVKQKLFQAIGSKDVDGVAAALQQLGLDVEVDEVLRWPERDWGQPACRVGTGQRQPAKDACSFCDARRDEVAKILSVRAVAICDRCVDDASADVLGVLLPP